MGTPVKVPPAAGSYTAATQDPDLRSQINACLLQNGHAAKIQELLLHSLHSHPANWPSTIQSHAVALLRSGEVSTFPALLRRVLDDIKQDTLAAPTKPTSNGVDPTDAAPGTSATNGNSKQANAAAPDPSSSASSLAVPPGVIEDGIKVTQDCLDTICDIEGSSS